MKLNPNSTRPQTSDIYEHYEHPWYKFNKGNKPAELIKPNPPSKESIERAKFVDKTYQWSGGNSVRPRGKRSNS
jgi:hypothetical protein